jgi:hypothetical protein
MDENLVALSLWQRYWSLNCYMLMIENGNWIVMKRLTTDSVTRFSTLGFFRQSITPRPLINNLKYFPFLFWIRRAITKYLFVKRDNCPALCCIALDRIWWLWRRIFCRIRNHMRKGFSLLIRDHMGLIDEKPGAENLENLVQQSL